MKNLLIILLPICLVWNTKSIGQNSTGAIVYEGFVNKAYVDSFTQAFNSRKDVNMSMKQRISNYYDYNNTVSDEFILLFDGTESNYKYISPLASENGDILGSLANKNPYYVNQESKIIIEKSRPLGSISHNSLEWKITKETKIIGKYNCYKAVTSERLYSRQGFYYNKQVIAWFTPEIPLNFGPSNYIGLPGLVLEVQRDKFTLRAKAIDLNPKDGVKLTRPKENETIITEEESHARIAEYMEEMESRRNN